MKRVRRRDTTAEISVRVLLRELGIHYRLNVANLPGKPDIAHKGKKKAIFVHGCFWHFHEMCGRGKLPRRNRAFWRDKLEGNRLRDERKTAELMAVGFDVLVVWECELKDPLTLSTRLEDFWHSTPGQDQVER